MAVILSIDPGSVEAEKLAHRRAQRAAYEARPDVRARRRAQMAANEARPETIAARAAQRRKPGYKAGRAAYAARPDQRAKKREFDSSPEAKAKRAEYRMRPEVRARQAKHEAERNSTIHGNLHSRMSRSVRWCLGTGKSGKRWPDLVGYTVEQLKQHLERQFLKGMTWENRGKWHIDHIVPVSHFTFDHSSDPAFRAAWALTNLRPLWAKENQQKSDKRTVLI
jgi:hypothetical protein